MFDRFAGCGDLVEGQGGGDLVLESAAGEEGVDVVGGRPMEAIEVETLLRPETFPSPDPSPSPSPDGVIVYAKSPLRTRTVVVFDFGRFTNVDSGLFQLFVGSNLRETRWSSPELAEWRALTASH